MIESALHNQLLDFLTGLNDVESVDSSWAKTITYMRELGVGHVGMRIGQESVDPLFMCTVSSTVADTYKKATSRIRDPRIEHCRRHVTPYFYGMGFWRQQPNLPVPLREYYEELAGAQAHTLAAIPVHTGSKRSRGWFAIGTGLEADEFTRMYRDRGAIIHMAGTGAFDRISLLASKEQAANTGITERERECLLWLGRGFRYDQIADCLGLCRVTVESHIAKARRKLNARTREQALVRAIQLNIIDP